MHFLTRLFLGAYGVAWRAAELALCRNKRLKPDFAQRLVPEGWPGDVHDGGEGPGEQPRTLWIQAASGGEAGLVHALVPAIAATFAARGERRPLRFVCSTWTRQGMEMLEKIPPPAPHSAILPRYFPLDRPDLMDKALRLLRPDAVILLETELWPALLAAATKAAVPLMIVNGRMTPKSLRAYRTLRFFWRRHPPARILAVSPEDAARFAALFACPEQVSVMPNIKFDRLAPLTLEDDSRPPDFTAHTDRQAHRASMGLDATLPLVLFASVREEEEDLLLPVAAALHGRSLLVVAPRHMHRIDAWKAKLEAAGIPCMLRSHTGEAPFSGSQAAPLPVCLWDRFGDLHSLYGVADAAYVGGSLAPLGGQNFLEAPATGLIPLVGPHTDNFRWAGTELFSEGLAVMVPDTNALLAALENALRTPQNSAEVQKRFHAWLSPRLGGSRQAAEALGEMLFEGGQE